MEDIIRQALVPVEYIGPYVADGRYDLIGPNGDIILPQAWEIIIQPDMAINMHMWPMPEPPKKDADAARIAIRKERHERPEFTSRAPSPSPPESSKEIPNIGDIYQHISPVPSPPLLAPPEQVSAPNSYVANIWNKRQSKKQPLQPIGNPFLPKTPKSSKKTPYTDIRHLSSFANALRFNQETLERRLR
jgi:hypothetical protein